jgi:hypothetical protein
VDAEPLSEELSQSELRGIWRPAVVRIFTYLLTCQLVVSVLFGDFAIRTARESLQVTWGLLLALLLVALVWPFYRRELPAQVFGQEGCIVALCWDVLGLGMFVTMWYGLSASPHAKLTIPPIAHGYMVGLVTMFWRITRWVSNLPK